jgi:hypothetical protein
MMLTSASAILNDSQVVRVAESSDDAFNGTLGGHSMKRWGMVMSDELCGMLFAAF